MNLGIVIIAISAIGYTSNWINWRFLDTKLNRWLYYLGALIHESSHALLCLATGAKIQEFKAFSSQPHVTHTRSKVPLIGQALISIAPIAGGLFFLYALDRLIGGSVTVPIPHDLYGIWDSVIGMITSLDVTSWQTWILIALSLNIGAMLGPSGKDLKNMWPALIIAFFIASPALTSLGLVAISLMIAGMIVQIALAAIIKIWSIV